MDPQTPDNNKPEGNKKGKKELTDSNRKALVVTLQSTLKDGRFPHGTLTKVGKQFGVHRSTVKKIWQEKSHLARDALSIEAEWFSSRSNRGVKKILFRDDAFVETVQKIPVSQRRTIRDMAMALNVSVGCVHKMVHDEGILRKHNSSIKPTLTDDNKLQRLAWCLDHIDPNTNLYDDMLDVIHLDEKWFNLTEVNKSCYLTSDETNPMRTTRHKGHIPRVMFLAAVARPRWDSRYNKNWDGKIGFWECVDMVEAQRSSRHHPRGTVEPKPFSIDGPKYKQLILEKVLPAIQEKCPDVMKKKQSTYNMTMLRLIVV